MAASILTDARIIVGSTDISQFSGGFQSQSSVNMVEFTPFGAGGYVRKIPGLQSHSDAFSGAADYASGAVSAVFNSSKLGEQNLITVMPLGDASSGLPAQFTRGLIQSINAPGGGVGDLATFDMATTSDTTKVFGVVAAPLAARASTANGDVITLAGPAAGRRMYAGLHITATSGTPSLTCKIQSAATVGFGSPTDRITFTAATTAGWQWSSVAGSITDGYWRAVFTISGGSPSLTCAVVLGVA